MISISLALVGEKGRIHVIRGSRLLSAAVSQPSIAVIGGGLSGCAAAQEFARKGFKVDLFEVGRGVGGRASTRRHGEFSFDHGSQYITQPKTGTFQKLLLQWMETGCVKPWEGSFAKVDLTGGQPSWSMSKFPRYVGMPTMNALCKQMVSSPLISCHFTCPVTATPEYTESKEVKWKLTSLRGDTLGKFDWVVIGDRGAALTTLKQSSPILNTFPLKGFVQALEDVFAPVPCLSLMVALRHQIPRNTFPHDTVSFKSSPVLGWLSRDSSKPGRARTDGQECWVIQSTTDFAMTIIKQIDEAAISAGEKLSFEERRQRVNMKAAEHLYTAFLDFLVQATPSQKALILQLVSTANIAAIEGHRWGAARPSLRRPLVEVLDKAHYMDLGNGLCFVDPTAHLAAAGDYLPADSRIVGIVEGAVCSGHQAARTVLQCIRTTSTPVV